MNTLVPMLIVRVSDLTVVGTCQPSSDIQLAEGTTLMTSASFLAFKAEADAAKATAAKGKKVS